MQVLMRIYPAVASIAATALLGGCFPAINHGARVERGGRFGVTAAGAIGATHREGEISGYHLRDGPFGFYAGIGIVPESTATRPSLYLGGTFPLLPQASQLDLYLQAPPSLTRSLAAGGGVALSATDRYLYGMLGGEFASKDSWYLAGGYGVRQDDGGAEAASRAVFGSAGLIFGSTHVRTQLFAQVATGRIPGSCSPDSFGRQQCRAGPISSAIAAGFSLGWQNGTTPEIDLRGSAR